MREQCKNMVHQTHLALASGKSVLLYWRPMSKCKCLTKELSPLLGPEKLFILPYFVRLLKSRNKQILNCLDNVASTDIKFRAYFKKTLPKPNSEKFHRYLIFIDWAVQLNFCCLLFKTAYIPSQSHRALNFNKLLKLWALVKVCMHLSSCLQCWKGDNKNLGGNVLGICFLKIYQNPNMSGSKSFDREISLKFGPLRVDDVNA